MRPGPEIPKGFHVSAARAAAIARSTSAARDNPADKVVLVRRCEQWQVRGSKNDKTQFLVLIDGRSGEVLSAWGGLAAIWPYARGSSALFVGSGMPWVMAILTLLFFAALVDPRRWRRALHLDLLVLLPIVVSLIPFGLGWIRLSTPLIFAGLCLLAARMTFLARGPATRPDPLVPYATPGLLLIATAVLLAGRGAYNVFVARASDVGYYSVLGAQSLLDGYSIYTQGVVSGTAYGPALHLAYLPFALIFPLPGGLLVGGAQAEHAAAITFDVLVAVALYVLGRRLRPGAAGHALGAVLAFAWAANPLGYYASAWSANDGFIALTLVLTLIAIESPAGRGVFAALTAAAKWVPGVLLPLFAAGTRPPERRATLFFVLAAVTTAALVTWPFLPDGGVREMYDVSLGDLAHVQTPFSVWGLYGLSDAVREVWLAAVGVAALACYWRPRTRSLAAVAALATAITAATQAGLPHWHYTYAAWFVPTAIVALALQHERATAA